MDKALVREARERAIKMLERAKIVLTPAEKMNIEICDYNLGNFYNS